MVMTAENNTIFTGESHGRKITIEMPGSDHDIYDVLDVLKAIVLGLGYAQQSWRAALEEDLRNSEEHE
jgi:hypothetical protein